MMWSGDEYGIAEGSFSIEHNTTCSIAGIECFHFGQYALTITRGGTIMELTLPTRGLLHPIPCHTWLKPELINL